MFHVWCSPHKRRVNSFPAGLANCPPSSLKHPSEHRSPFCRSFFGSSTDPCFVFTRLKSSPGPGAFNGLLRRGYHQVESPRIRRRVRGRMRSQVAQADDMSVPAVIYSSFLFKPFLLSFQAGWSQTSKRDGFWDCKPCASKHQYV